MKPSRKAWSLACALMFWFCAIVAPSAHAATCPPEGTPRRIFVTIGIDHYKHSSHWQSLTTAVADANSLEQLLETKFGYQSFASLANAEPLRDDKADRHAIDHLVVDVLPNIICPDDDLILFFSGHGESHTYPGGDIKNTTGYLVPADAPESGFSDLIEVKGFLEHVGHLPALHILVILDACYSGIAIQDARQGMKAPSGYKEAIANRKSRMVIVSAQADQTASDIGSIPGHSLFGGLLFQQLDQGLGVKSGHDFLADSDIADYLKESVVSKNDKQMPDSEHFLDDAGGALVLNLNEDLAGLYLNALHSLIVGNDDDFRLNAKKAIQRSPNEPRALALKYRLALRDGKIDIASSSIDKLRELAGATQRESGSFAISKPDLRTIRNQLNFWGSALQIPVTAPPVVEIKVYTGDTEKNLRPESGSNGFTITAEANIFFRLRAEAAETYVYVFLIDGLGRIHSQSGFLNQRQSSIDSKSTGTLSTVQSGPESNDIQEWHFIFSAHSIDEFLSPPSDTGKGGTPASAAELAGASHYVVTIRPKQ